MNYLINIGLGLILSLIFGRILIPILKKLHAGQSIREEGPKSHMVKSGTPTIGGLIFLFSAIIKSCNEKKFRTSCLSKVTFTNFNCCNINYLSI